MTVLRESLQTLIVSRNT